jgi:hypothetical protein
LELSAGDQETMVIELLRGKPDSGRRLNLLTAVLPRGVAAVHQLELDNQDFEAVLKKLRKLVGNANGMDDEDGKKAAIEAAEQRVRLVQTARDIAHHPDIQGFLGDDTDEESQAALVANQKKFTEQFETMVIEEKMDWEDDPMAVAIMVLDQWEE